MRPIRESRADYRLDHRARVVTRDTTFDLSCEVDRAVYRTGLEVVRDALATRRRRGKRRNRSV